MSNSTDIYLLNDANVNHIRVADDGKNYSNNKEIATVDQIPTNFSQIGDAANVVVEPNTVIRKTVVCAEKNGQGFKSRVALGLTNPGLLFSPAILSVGVNDVGTSFVDYVFGTNGRISSPTGTFALTSEIKALSGGAAPTAGQYVSGITVNDHAITVTKAALPTSLPANGGNSDTVGGLSAVDFQRAGSYAASSHNHDSVYAAKNHTHNYEPAFSKNSAFNRSFGTTGGTVAQGNHTHAGVTTMKAMYEFTISGAVLTPNLKKGSSIVISSPRNSGGNYTINHNLGHNNYVVILGTGKREGVDVIVKAGLIEQTDTYFKVQTSWGDQFHDGGFYATILTF